jgi:hypothetical protein
MTAGWKAATEAHVRVHARGRAELARGSIPATLFAEHDAAVEAMEAAGVRHEKRAEPDADRIIDGTRRETK